MSTIQNTSLNQHSTLWDASCPTFCKFLCPALDTAARLVSSVLVLRFTPWYATCCGFETKLSGVLLPSTPMLCSTHSRRLSLSFGDVVTSSAMACVPVGFLTETIQQREATRSHNRQGGITRTHANGIPTHTRAARRSQVSQVVFNYKEQTK